MSLVYPLQKPLGHTAPTANLTANVVSKAHSSTPRQMRMVKTNEWKDLQIEDHISHMKKEMINLPVHFLRHKKSTSWGSSSAPVTIWLTIGPARCFQCNVILCNKKQTKMCDHFPKISPKIPEYSTLQFFMAQPVFIQNDISNKGHLFLNNFATV